MTVVVKLNKILTKSYSILFKTIIYNYYFVKMKSDYYIPLHQYFTQIIDRLLDRFTPSQITQELEEHYIKYLSIKGYKTIDELININEDKTIELIEKLILYKITHQEKKILLKIIKTDKTNKVYQEYLSWLFNQTNYDKFKKLNLSPQNKIKGDYPYNIPIYIRRNKNFDYIAGVGNGSSWLIDYIVNVNPEGKYFILDGNVYKFEPPKLPSIVKIVNIDTFNPVNFINNQKKFVIASDNKCKSILIPKYEGKTPIINSLSYSIGIETKSIYILLPIFKKPCPKRGIDIPFNPLISDLQKYNKFLNRVKELLLLKIPMEEIEAIPFDTYTHEKFGNLFYIYIPNSHNFIRILKKNNIIDLK